MRRRQFIKLVGAAAAPWPLAARAQQSKPIPRIGVLWHAGNEQEEAIYLGALRQGFSEIGYIEGKDFVLENRYAAEQYEHYDPLAAELVAANVDVLVAVTTPAARAAQRATTTIPVVFVVVADPVGEKFVNSLARPGGNMTGVGTLPVDVSGKCLALFKEAVPRLTQVSLLMNPTYAAIRSYAEEYRAAAGSLGLTLREVQASKPDDLQAAITGITEDGLVVAIDNMLWNERKRIAELALSRGLPTMSWNSDMTDAGLLMSYGEDFKVQFRRIAVYVDKILKGAKPADLPVELPALYEFVINTNTARGLGLNIPPSVLALTDRVTG
ncbi:MAG: ABC transporter substrate-binding protein [Xanthobacteraceae bacterium]